MTQFQISRTLRDDETLTRILTIPSQTHFDSRRALARRVCAVFSFVGARDHPQLAGCMKTLARLARASPRMVLPPPRGAVANTPRQLAAAAPDPPLGTDGLAQPNVTRKPPLPERRKRLATCDLRLRHATPPTTRTSKENPHVLVSTGQIVACHPPEGEEPLQWFRLTTTKISTASNAADIVGYYLQRWRREDSLRVLKSGCGVKHLLLCSRKTATCRRHQCRHCLPHHGHDDAHMPGARLRTAADIRRSRARSPARLRIKARPPGTRIGFQRRGGPAPISVATVTTEMLLIPAIRPLGTVRSASPTPRNSSDRLHTVSGEGPKHVGRPNNVAHLLHQPMTTR